MPDLSVAQYSLVYNMFSFTFAAMLASFIFFVLSIQQIAPEYRNALIMSALVVAVAGYHYSRIFESWSSAFVLNDVGVYGAAPKGFNDAYRYVDWLLTVPLLVAELVAVLRLEKGKGASLTVRLAVAAVLMVALGYPGEVATDNGTRALWGTISTIPFIYIVYVLFTELGAAIERQPENTKVLFRNIRLLLLATWGFYPIVYMLPFISSSIDASTLVAVQVGYCIADVAAKCGYGFMIYLIAREKSEASRLQAVPVGAVAAAS